MESTAAALEQLYRTRYVRFRNGVAPVTGSYDSARDAVQEGFARALRAVEQFDGRGSLEGWVWRIVLRVALAAHQEDEGAELPLDDFDAALVEPERDEALAAAVRQLPPRRRLIVFLRYFADLPYSTIAEVCEVNEGTVAATLAHARSALAQILEKEQVRS